MATTNPFSKPAAPAAPVAVAPVAEAPVKVKKERVKKEGPRKTPAPQLTREERRFIVDHYATMDTAQIARELSKQSEKEVTKQQVYRTVLDTRITLKERLEEATAAGDKALIAKIQGVLSTLPEKAAFGGGGGKRGSSVKSLVDDLLG